MYLQSQTKISLCSKHKLVGSHCLCLTSHGSPSQGNPKNHCNSPKQSHNQVFHNNPQHLNLHTWCLGVDNSKNKASLWKWQRELLPLKGHQQGPSTSQSGPYLRNGAEKIWWILHSLCEASFRFLHVPVPRPKQAPFDL